MLISVGDLLRLQSNAFECDVIQFHHLLASDDEDLLADAVTLYRGPLLRGFIVPDAPAFEEWVQMEDAHLNHECAGALDKLIDLACTRKAWSKAENYLKQLI